MGNRIQSQKLSTKHRKDKREVLVNDWLVLTSTGNDLKRWIKRLLHI